MLHLHRITALLILGGASKVIWSNTFPQAVPARVQDHISKYGDSTTSLDHVCQGFVTLTVKQKVFLAVQEGPFCCHQQVCLLPLVLPPGTTEKILAVSLSTSSIQIPFDKISLSFSRLNSPSSLILSSQGRYSSPLNTFAALHWILSSIYLLYWGA